MPEAEALEELEELDSEAELSDREGGPPVAGVHLQSDSESSRQGRVTRPGAPGPKKIKPPPELLKPDANQDEDLAGDFRLEKIQLDIGQSSKEQSDVKVDLDAILTIDGFGSSTRNERKPD